MDYLFSESGSQALDYAAVGRTLFAFDFDGTLGDAQAGLPPDIRKALHLLARQARVAVITDRARASLLPHLPSEISFVVGHDGDPALPEGADGPRSKREALQALQVKSRCHSILFVGDDSSDEPVFEEAPDEWLTVHVGASAPSQARYFVNDSNEVASLLNALLARMSGWQRAG
jgi:trehalose-6-phosphatase